MHQLVEYVLGMVLVAQGLQSPTPVAPAVAGGLIVVNAAIVRGAPLSAFRLLRRAQHRALDLVVLAAVLVLALQPWMAVESGARLVMVGVAAVMGVVWWNSSFAERAPRSRRPVGAPGEARGTEVGRLAGRLVGDGINAARRMGKRS